MYIALTIIIILLYGLFIGVLWAFNLLVIKDLVSNISIFVGWIVALLLAGIHLYKTRKDSKALKKEEIKTSLKIDAFREINKAISTFSEIIGNIYIFYLKKPGDLKLHLQNPTVFGFHKEKTDLEIGQHIVELYNGLATFLLAIESNGIAVIQFDHLRKYIQFKVDDAKESIETFRENFNDMETKKLFSNDGYIEFHDKCNKLFNELTNIQMYLFDYRIELMNALLGKIFDSSVPVRKPNDSTYKLLTEVAIKEEVEKEEKDRWAKLLNKNHQDNQPLIK